MGNLVANRPNLKAVGQRAQCRGVPLLPDLSQPDHANA